MGHRKQAGFGLVELMLMVGVSLVVMLGLATMNDTNLRAQRSVASQSDWDQLINNAIIPFQNPVACTVTFTGAGFPPGAGFPVPVGGRNASTILLGTGAGATPMLTSGKQYQNVTLNPSVVPVGSTPGITVLPLGGVPPPGIAATQTVQIRIHGQTNVAAYGPRDVEKTIDATIAYDAVGVAQTCQLHPALDCSKVCIGCTTDPVTLTCKYGAACGSGFTLIGNTCEPCSQLGLVPGSTPGTCQQPVPAPPPCSLPNRLVGNTCMTQEQVCRLTGQHDNLGKLKK